MRAGVLQKYFGVLLNLQQKSGQKINSTCSKLQKMQEVINKIAVFFCLKVQFGWVGICKVHTISSRLF